MENLSTINAIDIENWILEHYPGVIVQDAYSERSFFYNPDGVLTKGVYFCTIKQSDGPNDKASNLDREGVFRFSFKVGKPTYRSLFGEVPKRPAKGNTLTLDTDSKELNSFMPHPIYAWMGWIAINSPTSDNFSLLKDLLSESFEIVLSKYLMRIK